jgi:TFIIF-interacting CTD phosphatase-like protein
LKVCIKRQKPKEIRGYIEQCRKHLLTEIPKYMDDTSLDFLDDLLPWSENLPEDCRKQTSYNQRGSGKNWSPVNFAM